MKKYRLLKKSFLARILGLLMVFLFLSAFIVPENQTMVSTIQITI